MFRTSVRKFLATLSFTTVLLMATGWSAAALENPGHTLIRDSWSSDDWWGRAWSWLTSPWNTREAKPALCRKDSASVKLDGTLKDTSHIDPNGGKGRVACPKDTAHIDPNG